MKGKELLVLAAAFGAVCTCAFVEAQTFDFTPRPVSPGQPSSEPKITWLIDELKYFPRVQKSDQGWLQEAFSVGSQQPPVYSVAGWLSMGVFADQKRYRASNTEGDLQYGMQVLYATLKYDARVQFDLESVYYFRNPVTGEPTGNTFNPLDYARIMVRVWYKRTGSLSTYASISELDPEDPGPPGNPWARGTSRVGASLFQESFVEGYNTSDNRPSPGWVPDGSITYRDFVFTRTLVTPEIAEFNCYNMDFVTGKVDVVARSLMPYANLQFPSIITNAFSKGVGKSRVEVGRACVIGALPVGMSGSVSSPDVTGAALSANEFTFELWGISSESLIWQMPSVSLDAETQGFSLAAITKTGTFELAARAPGFLKKRVTVVVSGDDVTGIAISLYAGDVNGDNVVNAVDLSLVVTNLNKTGYDADWHLPGSGGIEPRRCDFNLDGKVDSVDLDIVQRNQGRFGDV